MGLVHKHCDMQEYILAVKKNTDDGSVTSKPCIPVAKKAPEYPCVEAGSNK